MHDLAKSVNAGIRAPRAMNSDRRAFELRQRLFEQSLYRFAFSLPLPADEACAVVCEGEFQRSHAVTSLRDAETQSLRGFSASLSLCGPCQVRDPGFVTGLPSAHSGHLPSS